MFHIPGSCRLLGEHLQTDPLRCSGPTLSCPSGSHSRALEEKRQGRKGDEEVFISLEAVITDLHRQDQTEWMTPGGCLNCWKWCKKTKKQTLDLIGCLAATGLHWHNIKHITDTGWMNVFRWMRPEFHFIHKENILLDINMQT